NAFVTIRFLTSKEKELLEQTQKRVSFFHIKKLQELLRNTLLEFLNTPHFRSNYNSSFYIETCDLLQQHGYKHFQEKIKIREIPYFLEKAYFQLQEIIDEFEYQGVNTLIQLQNFKDQDYSNHKWLRRFNTYIKKNFNPYA